jgi:hypothetical protein
MADDWRKGDLALCVTDVLMPYTRPGAIYTVEATIMDVGMTSGKMMLGLLLEGVDMPEGATGVAARWFRRIPPRKADEFDRETIELMRGAPVWEPVA